MKRIPVSKYYIGTYLVGLFFCLIPLVVGLYGMKFLGVDFYIILSFVAGLVGCVIIVYQMVFDFQFAKVVVAPVGITMVVGFKKYYHSWEAIIDYGIVDTYVGDGNIAWLYFSERLLNNDEKKMFLRKTRKDLNSIAFFQYNKSSLQNVISLFPERISTKILEDEKAVLDKMTWIEKTYHK